MLQRQLQLLQNKFEPINILIFQHKLPQLAQVHRHTFLLWHHSRLSKL